MIRFDFLISNYLDNLNEPYYAEWLKLVVSSEGRKTGDIQYVFSDDHYLRNINKTFLSHDYFTDIITFQTSDNDNVVSGEIYISLDRVDENAKTHSVSLINELSRVMVHGILHLIGYNDLSESEKMVMRSKEDYYLHLQQQIS